MGPVQGRLPTLDPMKTSSPSNATHTPQKSVLDDGVREYAGTSTAPLGVVLRQWWSIEPNRPGHAWQYYVATAFYNAVTGTILSLFFALGNSRATFLDVFLQTMLISQCIGFSVHIGFDTFHRLTTPEWRAGLPKAVLSALHLVIPVIGVLAGYAIAFALDGKNFFEMAMRFPRSGMWSLLVGLGVSLVWYVIMDGQTRRLRADAQEARSRELAVQLQKQASDAELRALQAQIEPHFLFNTLANVQALIDYEPAKAKQMLESFIEYLRTTLAASRRSEATLGDEVTMLERYLQLMQVRMGKRLATTWDIDPALRAHPFAPLLLQPLVENAIKYGLEPKIEGGTISIRAREDQGRVTIEVQDDGVGLGARSSARKPRKPDAPAGTGTGIQNVRARLQATLGENATLLIANNTLGCCATLQFDSQLSTHPAATAAP